MRSKIKGEVEGKSGYADRKPYGKETSSTEGELCQGEQKRD